VTGFFHNYWLILPNNGVIVVCGIHASDRMEDVWMKHKKDPLIRVALDLFEIGIFICRKGLQKEGFVVRF